MRQQPGTKIVNPDTREIIYTPPEGEDRIRGLLGNLEAFANLQEDGLDPLVKLGVLHYQFEAIHPFYDGNGRTGRILLILYLVCAQLLDQPILFLSRYIIARKSLYYRRLRAVTEESAWEDWLLYVIRAIDVTAGITARKIKAIADLLGQMVEEARVRLNKRNFPKEIIEQFFVRPYCKIRHLESAGHGSRATASGYLHSLEKAGLVRKIRAGKEILFLNHRLLELLAEWEAVEAE